MNGVRLQTKFLIRMFMIVALFVSLTAVPSNQLMAEEDFKDVKIHYSFPWKVGLDTIDTIKDMKYVSPTLMAYVGKGGVNQLMASIKMYKKNEVDIAITNRDQWFNALNAEQSLFAVAEMGPYIAIVIDDVFKRKNTLIAKFLRTWQSAWLSTGYPYGVQPPQSTFLQKKYSEFMKGRGIVRIRNIKPFVKTVIKEIAVKFSPRGALVINRDYYISAGISFRGMIIANTGESYVGRIIDEFNQYINFDKNPCEREMVNIEKPYYKDKTGKTKNCESKEWDIYKVTKR